MTVFSRTPGVQRCSPVKMELKVKCKDSADHPSSSSSSSLSCWTLVGQRDEDLDVVEGKEARLAVQHPLVPVLVDLVGQRDDVALVEAQLALVLGLKVVQRLTAGLLQGR